MTAWFDNGRAALFDALRGVCDQMDRDLKAELEQRKGREHKQFTEELDILRKHASDADRLEEENAKLRGKLLRLQAEQREGTDIEGSRASPRVEDRTALELPSHTYLELSPGNPQTIVSSAQALHTEVGDEDKDWKLEHAKLAKRYNKLLENLGILKASVLHHKEKTSQWIKYAEHLESRLEARKNRSADAAGVSKSTSGRFQLSPLESLPVPAMSEPNNNPSKPSMSSSFVTDAAPQQHKAGQGNPPETEAGLEDNSEYSSFDDQASEGIEARILTRHTTEETGDLLEPELPPLPDADNAAPVGVAIKSEPTSDIPIVVNEHAVRKRKHNGSEVSGLRRVKTEDSSSNVVAVSYQQRYNLDDSLDLDDVGQKVSTPRKRRAEETAPSHRPSLDATTARTNLVPGSESSERIANIRSPRRSSVLTPISGNIPRLNPRCNEPAQRARKQGLSSNISSLAEDGVNYKRNYRNAGGDWTSFRGKDAGDILGTLLNKPSPDSEHKIVRSAPRPRQSVPVSSERPLLQIAAHRELHLGKDRASKLQDNPQTARAAREELPTTRSRANSISKALPKSIDHSAGPLRTRPLSACRLADFKINQNYNGGHDYAFTEVVRGKDKRAELQGCVDMNCCGPQWRALALSHLAQRCDTPDQWAADHALLEDYLGDQASRLASMSKEEREQLLVEAKMRELANKHGKHRHRYSRMQSPPGFWRTGWPDTQEMDEDRKEAEKREKEIIRERYNEAMRPGGRWIFRNE